MLEHWFLNFFCLCILEEFDLLLSVRVAHYDSDSQLELGQNISLEAEIDYQKFGADF